MKKIFVSHASKDGELVNLFVDEILVKGLEIKSGEIFSISTEGLGIKSGVDFVTALKDHLAQCEIAILMLSENYKASEVCLNEMGAVWVLSKKIFPFILRSDNFNFESVGVVHRNNQIAELNSQKDLDGFRDQIVEAMKLHSIPTARWNSSVKKFLEKAKEIKLSPPGLKVDMTEYQKIIAERDSIQEEYNELDEEKEKLEQHIKELEKTKDAQVVKKLKKKFNNAAPLEEFEESINQINKLFKIINNTAVARTVLAEFARVVPNIDYEKFGGFTDKLEDAQRRLYLDSEHHCTDKHPIPEIKRLLNKLNNIELSNGFSDAYTEEYKIDFNPQDQDFWDKHFDY